MPKSKLRTGAAKHLNCWPAMSGIALWMMFVAYSPLARATSLPTAPVVVEACPSCASLTDLQNYAIEALGGYAVGYLNNAPVSTVNGVTYYVEPATLLGVPNPSGGTEIFVASMAYPIAAELRYSETILTILGKPTAIYQAVPITPDNMGTAALDALTHARAADIPPIIAPADLGTANSYGEVELLTGFVNGVLVGTTDGGASIWRALAGFSQTVWITVVDTQNGQKYTLWNGDEVTLKFSDGSTIKIKFVAIGGPGGITFQVDLGSARDPHGDPYGIAGLVPGGGSTNYGCGPGGVSCVDVPAVPTLCFYAVEVCWSGECTFGWDPCGS